ncbi:MAG: pseudouridine synthase [Paracoccaceae bacterium]
MSDETTKGERIAKVMARAGVASRRDAEKMILAGRVAVNGEKITTPALDVLATDKVTLDGKPIDAPQPARLWLYYKPIGLVTSAKDEKGRQTVFDTMPEGMPRVMSVGRLDLNSEGLLLLTNDGALKRRLELPSTGWLRKYRVRVNGRPNDATFDPLRRGVTIEGEEFQPMEISLDKQQGANAWLTVGLREGKNREVRRAMAEVGLVVNRLIRVSYGPFRLNTMKPGDVVEVKARVLREQLGDDARTEKPEGRAERKPRAPKPGHGKKGGPRKFDGPRPDARDRKPRFAKADEGERAVRPRRTEDDAGPDTRKARPAHGVKTGKSVRRPAGTGRPGEARAGRDDTAKSGKTFAAGKPRGPGDRSSDRKADSGKPARRADQKGGPRKAPGTASRREPTGQDKPRGGARPRSHGKQEGGPHRGKPGGGPRKGGPSGKR